MLKNRPAAFLCLVFSAGTAAGLFFGNYYLLLALGSLLVFSILLLVSRRKRSKPILIIALGALALILGATYLHIYSALFSPPTPEANKEYTFNAAVRQVERYNAYSVIYGEVQDSSVPFDGKNFRMYTYTNAPSMGEMITVNGSVSPSDTDDRGGSVHYLLRGSYTSRPDLEPVGFFFRVLKLRLRVGELIDEAYGDECSAFYKALLIGDRSGLSSRFNGDFARSGLSHVIAISGQHFSIIVMGVYSLLMLLFNHRKLCCGITAFLAVAYMIFTGGSPSIVRAAFMCCAVLITAIFDEHSDPLINLSLSLVIILLFNPYAIQNVSLQLSYAATIGIIFTMDHLNGFFQEHKTPRLFQLVAVPLVLSVVTNIFCTPVFMSSFKQISVMAPISNILVGWMISMAMIFGIVLLPVALFFDGAYIVPLALFNGINGVAEWVSDMRFACVSVDVPYMFLLALPSLAICVGFGFFRPKKGMAVFLGAFLSAALIVTGCLHLQGYSHERNALVYLKDGTRNSFTIYADKSDTVLIDGIGNAEAASAVMAEGYTYLDAYILTACTEDSLARLRGTLPTLAVNTVFIPEVDSKLCKDIIGVAFEKDCRVIVFKGSCISYAELTVYIPKGGEGGHTIKIERDGKELLVLGSNSGETDFYTEKTDGVILSKAAAVSSVPYDKLPVGNDKLFSAEENDYTTFLKSGVCLSAELYSGDAAVRIGKDGIFKE